MRSEIVEGYVWDSDSWTRLNPLICPVVWKRKDSILRRLHIAAVSQRVQGKAGENQAIVSLQLKFEKSAEPPKEFLVGVMKPGERREMFSSNLDIEIENSMTVWVRMGGADLGPLYMAVQVVCDGLAIKESLE